MVFGDTLCQLGHFLDEWGESGATIQSVTIDREYSPETAQNLTTEVTVAVPMALPGEDDDSAVECTPTVTASGSLAVSIDTNLPVPSADGPVIDTEPVDSTLQPDGTVAVTVAVTVEGDSTGRNENATGTDDPNERGETVETRDEDTTAKRNEDTSDRSAAEHAGSTRPERVEDTRPEPAEGTRTEPAEERRNTGASAGRSRGVPPFKDPELLKEVYDTHDTFAEMADALEMDVTGETVRRYMIDFDIHQPNSYRSGSDDGATEEDETQVAGEPTDDGQQLVAISDGIGLPEGISVEDVIDTVNRSNTIYEVKKDLDLERQEAHEMLKELNLMDLVLGRLSDDSGREITREDVIERLRTVSEAR